MARGDSSESSESNDPSANTVCALGLAGPHQFLSSKDETENELMVIPWLTICSKSVEKKQKAAR